MIQDKLEVEIENKERKSNMNRNVQLEIGKELKLNYTERMFNL